MKNIKSLVSFLLVALVVSCGGGGGSAKNTALEIDSLSPNKASYRANDAVTVITNLDCSDCKVKINDQSIGGVSYSEAAQVQLETSTIDKADINVVGDPSKLEKATTDNQNKYPVFTIPEGLCPSGTDNCEVTLTVQKDSESSAEIILGIATESGDPALVCPPNALLIDRQCVLCPAGSSAINGQCIKECPEGTSLVDNACVPIVTGCEKDSDCTAGEECNDDGQCVKEVDDNSCVLKGCPSDKSCNVETGQCTAPVVQKKKLGASCLNPKECESNYCASNHDEGKCDGFKDKSASCSERTCRTESSGEADKEIQCYGETDKDTDRSTGCITETKGLRPYCYQDHCLSADDYLNQLKPFGEDVAKLNCHKHEDCPNEYPICSASDNKLGECFSAYVPMAGIGGIAATVDMLASIGKNIDLNTLVACKVDADCSVGEGDVNKEGYICGSNKFCTEQKLIDAALKTPYALINVGGKIESLLKDSQSTTKSTIETDKSVAMVYNPLTGEDYLFNVRQGALNVYAKKATANMSQFSPVGRLGNVKVISSPKAVYHPEAKKIYVAAVNEDGYLTVWEWSQGKKWGNETYGTLEAAQKVIGAYPVSSEGFSLIVGQNRTGYSTEKTFKSVELFAKGATLLSAKDATNQLVEAIKTNINSNSFGFVDASCKTDERYRQIAESIIQAHNSNALSASEIGAMAAKYFTSYECGYNKGVVGYNYNNGGPNDFDALFIKKVAKSLAADLLIHYRSGESLSWGEKNGNNQYNADARIIAKKINNYSNDLTKISGAPVAVLNGKNQNIEIFANEKSSNNTSSLNILHWWISKDTSNGWFSENNLPVGLPVYDHGQELFNKATSTKNTLAAIYDPRNEAVILAFALNYSVYLKHWQSNTGWTAHYPITISPKIPSNAVSENMMQFAFNPSNGYVSLVLGVNENGNNAHVGFVTNDKAQSADLRLNWGCAVGTNVCVPTVSSYKVTGSKIKSVTAYSSGLTDYKGASNVKEPVYEFKAY